jgi:hypothetical protein
MRHHTWQGQLHHHQLTSCDSKAHVLSPRCASEAIRWARNPSDARGTSAMVTLVAEGSTVMSIRGQGLRCLEAACTTYRYYDLCR